MISNNKENIIIIPARLNSSRLSRKLLLNIGKKSILQHTYENSIKSKYSSRSVILVDSPELFSHCKTFTDDVVLTSNKHNSGTERILEFLENENKYQNIVNVQADEPFISPNLIDDLFLQLKNGENIVTYGLLSNFNKYQNNHNEVKIVLDKKSYAIYFSRSDIPFFREKNINQQKLIHIGIYGYKRSELILFGSYKNNKLENIEKLEQLRFIENNVKIKVLITDKFTVGIDTMEDYNNAIKYYEEKHIK